MLMMHNIHIYRWHNMSASAVNTSPRVWYMSDYLDVDRFLKIIKCVHELYIIMHLHAFVYGPIQPLVS